jgi:8-oxo-dGTP diphosphatase
MSDSTTPVTTRENWASWSAEVCATLMFIVEEDRILLIRKKRGIGAGKINGPGGKIDPGETPLEAAVRETQEELCITPLNPRKLGELWFSMSDSPHLLCHVYRADIFLGTPAETEEAVPLWFPLDSIPYHEMWEDDIHWLPLLLEETPFFGKFIFDCDSLKAKDIQTVQGWE